MMLEVRYSPHKTVGISEAWTSEQGYKVWRGRVLLVSTMMPANIWRLPCGHRYELDAPPNVRVGIGRLARLGGHDRERLHAAYRSSGAPTNPEGR